MYRKIYIYNQSAPAESVFVDDSADCVRRKIRYAYCPPGIIDCNPCLNWTKLIIFGKYSKFEIKRKEKNGGNVAYHSYEQV